MRVFRAQPRLTTFLKNAKELSFDSSNEEYKRWIEANGLNHETGTVNDEEYSEIKPFVDVDLKLDTRLDNEESLGKAVRHTLQLVLNMLAVSYDVSNYVVAESCRDTKNDRGFKVTKISLHIFLLGQKTTKADLKAWRLLALDRYKNNPLYSSVTAKGVIDAGPYNGGEWKLRLLYGGKDGKKFLPYKAKDNFDWRDYTLTYVRPSDTLVTVAAPEKKRTVKRSSGYLSPRDTEKIEFVLSRMSAEVCDTYESWISVAMACKGLSFRYDTSGNAFFEAFDNWSSQSEKYKKKALEKYWSGIKKRENAYGWPKLIELADCSDEYNAKFLDEVTVEEANTLSESDRDELDRRQLFRNDVGLAKVALYILNEDYKVIDERNGYRWDDRKKLWVKFVRNDLLHILGSSLDKVVHKFIAEDKKLIGSKKKADNLKRKSKSDLTVLATELKIPLVKTVVDTGYITKAAYLARFKEEGVKVKSKKHKGKIDHAYLKARAEKTGIEFTKEQPLKASELRELIEAELDDKDDTSTDMRVEIEAAKESLSTLRMVLKKTQSKNSLSAAIEILWGELKTDAFLPKLNKPDDRSLIPISGGKILCLRDSSQRPRTREDFFSFELVAPAEEVSDKVLDFITPLMQTTEELQYLQMLSGTFLSGHVRREIYVAQGQGRNGKSVYNLAMSKVMGPLHTSLSQDVFIATKKKDAGSATSHLMPLADVHLGVYTESEDGDTLNSAILKAISGGDGISVRRNFGEQETLHSRASLLLMTNERPAFSVKDGALINRLRYIPFTTTFGPGGDHPANEKLVNYILTHPEEMMAWMVEGARMYFQRGETLEPPPRFQAEKKDAVEEQDTVLGWFRHHTSRSNLNGEYLKDLYENYQENSYCKRKLTRKAFSEWLEIANLTKTKKKKLVFFEGVILEDSSSLMEDLSQD